MHWNWKLFDCRFSLLYYVNVVKHNLMKLFNFRRHQSYFELFLNRTENEKIEAGMNF